MSAALEAVLDRILADPLAGARNADAPVGYVGLDVPLDLMLASPRYFCHLPWQVARPTPQADTWLESTFPGWSRSILEDWLQGAFDDFDAVIFSRGDDACQRLYYYICELQRIGIAGGPRPLVYDGAYIPRDSSNAHCRLALSRLMRALDIDVDALPAGIGRANAWRELMSVMAHQRTGPGRLYEKIARASLFQDLSGALLDEPLEKAAGMPRLLLAGSVPPDMRFHVAAEAAGWNLVAELHQLTLTRHGPAVDITTGDPLSRLAGHYNTLAGGPRSFMDREQWLRDTLASSGAQAALLWLTEEDEALAWHAGSLRKVLADRGLPALVLARRAWDDHDGAGELVEFLGEVRP